jgi:hypothetical protein
LGYEIARNDTAVLITRILARQKEQTAAFRHNAMIKTTWRRELGGIDELLCHILDTKSIQ